MDTNISGLPASVVPRRGSVDLMDLMRVCRERAGLSRVELQLGGQSGVVPADGESEEEGEIREDGGAGNGVGSVFQVPARQEAPRVTAPSAQLVRRRDPARTPTLTPGAVAGPDVAVLNLYIVGHSFVRRAERAEWDRHQALNLGLDPGLYRCHWRGKGGRRWHELLPLLNTLVKGGVCPDVVVIHLGENDLVQCKGLALLKQMRQDLQEIGRRWAGCHVIWSEFIPRRVWRGAERPGAIDRARRKINREMRVFCAKEGVGRMEHPELCYGANYFFLEDGVHLSRYGMELYIVQLKEAIDGALGVVRYPRRQES
ncbi:uncharacterized protein LOC144826212 [Lissotriton helveticus]